VNVQFRHCGEAGQQCARVAYIGDINCEGSWTFNGEGAAYEPQAGCNFVYQGNTPIQTEQCWNFVEELTGDCLSNGGLDIAELEDGNLLFFWGAGRSQAILTPSTN
jgi:hypothetical protein